MQEKQTTNIKVTRDTKTDYWLTVKPIIKTKAINLARKIDYWFVHNKWPESL